MVVAPARRGVPVSQSNEKKHTARVSSAGSQACPFFVALRKESASWKREPGDGMYDLFMVP